MGCSKDDDSAPPRTIEVVADKSYHKAQLLQELKNKRYRTYIAVPAQKGNRRWRDKGGHFTARTFDANRDRVSKTKGRGQMRKRGELFERSFGHVCETGDHRRVGLRGRENVGKRYLIQVAAVNLGPVLRALLGVGTPEAGG